MRENSEGVARYATATRRHAIVVEVAQKGRRVGLFGGTPVSLR